MGKTPNLAVFNNNAYDMDIMTLCIWAIQHKIRFFYYYLEAHQKILHSTHAML
jgi:hypothetical protein